jgi:uncharacterized coiled-coil protein SlyX
MERVLEYLAKEGALVKGAPLAFLTGVVVLGAVIWVAMEWRWSGIKDGFDANIAALEQRITQKDETVADLQAKLTTAETALAEALRRVDDLKTRLLNEELSTKPSDRLQIVTGNSAAAIVGQDVSMWTTALKSHGWTVDSTIYVDGGAYAEIAELLKSGVVMQPATAAGFDAIQQTLDAANIKYQRLPTGGNQGAAILIEYEDWSTAWEEPTSP